MPLPLASIRPKRLPKLVFLLISAVLLFVFLAPVSLQTFGPPPGLPRVRNALGFEAYQAQESGGASLEAQVTGRQQKANLVFDLQRFKPNLKRPSAKIIPAAVAPKQTQPPAVDTKASSNKISSICPDPFKPAPAPLSLPPGPFDMTQCQDLDATSEDFKVSACPASTASTCNSFFVVIERKDIETCQAAYQEPISQYKKDAEQIRKETGPDTFQVLVSGSERYSVSRHIGYDNLEAPCRYIYPVSLSNAGPFSLQILHLYELWHGHADYMAPKRTSQIYYAAKDTIDDEGTRSPLVPRIIQDALFPETPGGILSSQLPKSIPCPSTCKSYSFSPNIEDSPTGSLRVLSDLSTRYDALPLCSKLDPIAGAYFPDPTPVQNTSLPVVQYRWHPLGCRLSTSNVQMLDGEKGLSRRKQCLGQTARRVVFQGDSHTRMSYDALMARLRDLGDERPVYGKAKVKENTFYKTDFTFVWDSHFIRLMRDPAPPKEADILVLSLGAHQARNRWLTRTFDRLLDRITTHLLTWTSKSMKVLFITVPAKQPYNADWRTHPRVQSWSDLTIEKHKAAGLKDVGFVEGYSSTLPFTAESPDGIHFRDLPAQEAWLLQLIHKMDLCGSDD